MEKYDIQIWKFGTAITVSSENGLQTIEKKRIHKIASGLKSVIEQTKKKVIITSSGAVAAGQAIDNFDKSNGQTNAQKRRFSGKGWRPLINEWEIGFGDLAERLSPERITHSDANSAEFWEYAEECFKHNDVLLLNGNDAAAADFVDNDKLTGDVACAALQQEFTKRVEAIFCTDVEGFMINGHAQDFIDIDTMSKAFLDQHCGPISNNLLTGSTGGMRSKSSQAARIVRIGGKSRIMDGTKPKNITNYGLNNTPIGTEFIKQAT